MATQQQFSEIEEQAIAQFVAQSRKLTGAELDKVLRMLDQFGAGTACTTFEGHKIGPEVMREAARRVREQIA